MKAEELTVLDQHELSDRLKSSRRELYELRFQVAVGQLENNREIRKVKKDIARILTVIRSRELQSVAPVQAPPSAAVAGELRGPREAGNGPSPESGEVATEEEEVDE